MKSSFIRPNQIPGLMFWADPSDISTITKSGADLVSQLVDKSSNAYVGTQSTDGNKFTWNASAFNDVPSLLGSNNSNLTFGNVLDMERTEARTYVFVYYNNGSNTNTNIFGKNDANSPYPGWVWRFDTNSTCILYVDNNLNNNRILKRFGCIPEKGIAILTYSGSSTAAGVNMYVNGILQNSVTQADNLTASSLTSVTFNIGKLSANAFRGYYGDMIIYDHVLTDDERKALEWSLSNKWNISLGRQWDRRLDNNDAGVTKVGSWLSDGGAAVNLNYYLNSTGLYIAAGTGGTATYSFTGLDSGYYKFLMSYHAAGNRPADASITMFDNNTSLASVVVNQQVSPFESGDEVYYKYLGMYNITSGTGKLQIAQNAVGATIMDAVVVERVKDLPVVPTSISGLQLWLDASDISSITKDGSNKVSQWNDKSGNSRHAIQATSGNQPVYEATGFGTGLPTIYADNLQYLSCGDVCNIAFTDSATIFYVLSPQSGTTVPMSKTAPTTLRGWELVSGTGYQTALKIYEDAASKSWEYRTTSTSLTHSSKRFVHCITYNGGSTTNSGVIYLNGQMPAQGSLVLGAPTNSISTANLLIGGRGATYSYNRIGEILIYNRLLTPSERKSVEAYLSHKWLIYTY